MGNRAITVSVAVISLMGMGMSACVPLGPSDPEEGPSAQQQALAEEATEATILVAALSYQLSSLVTTPPMRADDLPPPGGSGGGGEPDPATPGPGGAEPIDAETEACTSLEWNVTDPLRLTIYFADCVSGTGESINGSIAVFLNYDGVRGAVGIDVDMLQVGARYLDGFLVVSSDRTDFQVDCDVTYIDADTNLGVVMSGANLSVQADGVHFDGSGILEDDGERYAFDANDLAWTDPGACYPTQGSLDLELPGQPAMTVLFARRLRDASARLTPSAADRPGLPRLLSENAGVAMR